MAFAMEWIKGQDLWETKAYGKYDAVSYVRTFLGDDQVYVVAKDVLFFETFPGCYRCNPFIKQAMDSIYYNQIEIIAYDDGTLGDFDEYLHILRKCGYFYIKKIILAPQFGLKHANYRFYSKMIGKENKHGKKYGMISKHVNLFAKKQKADHLLYVTPDQHPQRYFYGKHLKMEERMFQNFVNESLFQGSVKETKGYYFGYAFEGIFLDAYCRFVKYWKEENNIQILYFPYNAASLAQAYSTLYQEDRTEILYADENTKRNRNLIIYLNYNIWKNSAVVDLSIEENFTKYIRENVDTPVKTLNLCDFFKKNDLKKNEDQIQKAIEMMKDPGFIVEEYDQGLAVWNEDKFDIQEIRNVQEIQKGAIEFVDKFHECSEKSVYRKNQYEIFDHSFVADVMEYAFDEKKRGKIHKTLEQKIIQSAKIRKVIQKLKKLKNILKGAAL